MMNYPKLKCEDKQNTTVCSLTLKKMKELRKTGMTYTKIARELKVSSGSVFYHISPSQNNPESKEAQRDKSRKYNTLRYKTDPVFRRKMLDSIIKSHAMRRKDPNYKKWEQAISKRNFKTWSENRQKLHPTWSVTCVIGSHEITSHTSRCKNKAGNCKCPCHINNQKVIKRRK